MSHSTLIATPTIRRRIAWCTVLLCAATAVMSAHAALEISGSWLGRVRIVQLEHYGLRIGYLADLELWRLVTAQLVHVKQPHMISNVFCLLLVGTAVERNLGPLWLFALWLVGGATAMLISTLFVTYPLSNAANVIGGECTVQSGMCVLDCG